MPTTDCFGKVILDASEISALCEQIESAHETENTAQLSTNYAQLCKLNYQCAQTVLRSLDTKTLKFLLYKTLATADSHHALAYLMIESLDHRKLNFKRDILPSFLAKAAPAESKEAPDIRRRIERNVTITLGKKVTQINLLLWQCTFDMLDPSCLLAYAINNDAPAVADNHSFVQCQIMLQCYIAACTSSLIESHGETITQYKEVISSMINKIIECTKKSEKPITAQDIKSTIGKQWVERHFNSCFPTDGGLRLSAPKPLGALRTKYFKLYKAYTTVTSKLGALPVPQRYRSTAKTAAPTATEPSAAEATRDDDLRYECKPP